METITRAKIAEELKSKTGLSGPICETLVNEIFASIKSITYDDGKLVLNNFGRFWINHKKSRPGMNLKTGEKVTIPPKTVFRFAAATKLKDALNIKSC